MNILNLFRKATKQPNAIGTPITMEILKGIVTWQGQNANSFVFDGYAGNDIVYSIITLITQKAKVAPWSTYKVNDVKKFAKYKAMMQRPDLIKDWREVANLKKDALTPLSDDKLNELLTYPNSEDTFDDFIEQWAGFKLITGNSYIWANLIDAGANKGKPLELVALPSQYMSIIADIRQMPPTKTGYQLYIGTYWKYTVEEILHDKYFNPQWNASGMQLYGMSPLQAAAKVLTRNNEAKTASVSNLTNGGPAGVLYVDDQRLNSDVLNAQVVALKNKLMEYTGSKNKNKVATSGYKVGWQSLGLSNVDLDILNSEKFDLRALCNIYGVPSALLNDPDGKTYNNLSESEKALTVRAAIPILTSIRENLNRKLASDWGYKGQNIVVDFDLSVYPELQEDKAEQVTWLNQAWWLPLERKYEIMGEKIPDYLDEETRQSIYLPMGLQEIKEVDDTLNNNNLNAGDDQTGTGLL